MESPPLAVLAQRLAETLGPQGWWPASTHWEMMVGAVLVQHTSWRAVETALRQVDAAGLLAGPAPWRAASPDDLVPLLRPAGPMRAKARTLQDLAHLLAGHADDPARLFRLPAPALRQALLGIRGIGPETADCIVLYGAGHPVFVVDAYARRILARAGHPDAAARPYAGFQAWATTQLPPDAAALGDLHAHLVAVGKEWCRPREPRCGGCPLTSLCRHGRQWIP